MNVSDIIIEKQGGINMSESDEELAKVSGGSDRETTVMVKVFFSDCVPFSGDVSIKPYLNGTLLTNQARIVDASCDYVNVMIQGRGIALLAVKINNIAVKNYVVDFDKGTYSQS